jgi:hypothetical protein
LQRNRILEFRRGTAPRFRVRWKGDVIASVRFGFSRRAGPIEHVFHKEILMRQLFALVAILGLGVAIVGCGEQKKPAAPAAPAAPAGEAPK